MLDCIGNANIKDPGIGLDKRSQSHVCCAACALDQTFTDYTRNLLGQVLVV